VRPEAFDDLPQAARGRVLPVPAPAHTGTWFAAW
jgi:hypothetical protein